MNTPIIKISIIITVYNIGKYLKQCLDSVVTQTLEEIEIIIVNDCSPDQDDEKMCLAYQKKYLNIKYIKNKKNKGLFITRMVGIEAANGEYIGFVDADDFIAADMYKSMYEKSIKNNVDILESFVNNVNIHGKKLGENNYIKPSIKYSETPFKDIIDNIKWSYCNKIYKKVILKKAVNMMPKIRITMGEDLLANLIIFYFAKTYMILEKPFYNYRQNPDSATNGALTLKCKIESLILIHTQYKNIFKQLLDNDTFDQTSIKIINHIKEAIIHYAGSNIANQIIVKNVAYDFFKKHNQPCDFFTDFKLKSPSSLNIALVGYTSNGGAGIATQRLHQGLLNLHINSSYFLLRGFSQTLRKGNYYTDIPKKQNYDLTQLSKQNIYQGNTIFSLSYPSLSFNDLAIIANNNDIINLHWISRILSTEAIAYLSHSNKPIVWTLHDSNPLTGGCHSFHGCENWKTDCMRCPQLIDNYDNYPAKILAAKKKYINFKNITVVVLNQHFKRLIEQSPLFNESRIEVIPNSIDTDKFKPLDKEQTREKLGLDKDKKYLLYVAASSSKIKGYAEFEQTVDVYEKVYGSDNIEILLAGNLPKERNIKLPFKELGHVDEDRIIELYSASDVTVLSSVEDNLPNVILESFSCGTPIVGFKIGGLPDMVKDGYNGYLDGNPNPVLCSSPFQTHKRYKINLLPETVDGVAYGEYGKSVDLVFNLDPDDNSTEIRRYQVLQKVNNYTDVRLDGYKIEVRDENGSKNPALTLSLGEGEGDEGADIWAIYDRANYSHGLWGPYEENKGVVRFDNGFFDYKRAYFPVELSDNNHTISYFGDMNGGIDNEDGGNYQEIFGNWLPSIWEPTGIFFDEDHDPATDNELQAFYGVAPDETELAWWKSSVEYDPSTPNIKPVYTWLKATAQDMNDWSGEWYNEGPIEDVLNLGLNYIINVGANAAIGKTFILRLTPHIAPEEEQVPPIYVCGDDQHYEQGTLVCIDNTDPEVPPLYLDNHDGTMLQGTLDLNDDAVSTELDLSLPCDDGSLPTLQGTNDSCTPIE